MYVFYTDKKPVFIKCFSTISTMHKTFKYINLINLIGHEVFEYLQEIILRIGRKNELTPFRKDCKNIQPASRKNFLADGSAVLCKEMGTIDIPITNGQTKLEILKLDNVLICTQFGQKTIFSQFIFTKFGCILRVHTYI